MAFAFIRNFINTNILFILGPSGVGKTTFCEYLSNQHNWIHLNHDDNDPQLPNKNQLEIEKELNLFVSNFNVWPLYCKIRNKFMWRTRPGIVLSFPSNFLISANHIRAAKGYFKILYLYGNQQNCLNAFNERERLNGRNFSEYHWHYYNRKTYEALDCPSLRPWIIEAFHQNGTRKSMAKIYDKIVSIN
jgi:hypothetical protein